MPSDGVVMAREEWDRIRQLEATVERLQSDLAVAVGNPCAGCQAENAILDRNYQHMLDLRDGAISALREVVGDLDRIVVACDNGARLEDKLVFIRRVATGARDAARSRAATDENCNDGETHGS